MAVIRGIRNNNPFNIKRSSSRWLGKVPFKDSTDPVFEQFTDIDYGLRAGFILLRNYIKRGDNTYRKIITRFAPSSENDVDSYLSYLSDDFNWNPDCVIKFRSKYFFHLVVKMCFYESHYLLSFDKYFTILHKFHL